jgi:hypothetical protein
VISSADDVSSGPGHGNVEAVTINLAAGMGPAQRSSPMHQELRAFIAEDTGV